MAQLYTRFEMEFLPVYYPSAAEKADAKLYADNVRNVMAKYGILSITSRYDQSHQE